MVMLLLVRRINCSSRVLGAIQQFFANIEARLGDRNKIFLYKPRCLEMEMSVEGCESKA